MGASYREVRQRLSSLPSPFADDYNGSLWIASRDSLDALYPKLFIQLADPKIRIAGQLIESIARGNSHPSAELNEGVLRIQAENQVVVYRLVRFDDLTQCWLAEWPD